MLVKTFERMRSNHSFDLHGQPERHQLRDHEVNTASESDAEVYAEDLAIRCVDEKVLQVAISDAYQVGGNTEYSNALDELVLDGKEGRRCEAKVLEAVS